MNSTTAETCCNRFCKAHIYRGILSSVVADDTKPSRMPLGPLSDVINLSIDDQPLVVPAAVALHLLPGVDAPVSPAARLPRLRQLASTSHPHRRPLALILIHLMR